MQLNVTTPTTHRTHEGAPARRITSADALRRSVMSCMLWEREFYDGGEDIAASIARLCGEVEPAAVARIAIDAREISHLRHAPLLLCAHLARRGTPALVADTIARCIQRADELAEFVAVYADANGVAPSAVKPKLSNPVRRGIARAFGGFSEYQLAKYNRNGAVKLRDVLRLCHPKPRNEAQSALWRRLSRDELATPDTWEVALSGGAGKRETFERLLREGTLGYLALLRNLRNMVTAGCDATLVRDAILARGNGADKVLPFRFIAAARACPSMEPALDEAMQESVAALPPLSGTTLVLVDVSPSMDAPLSARSDMSRMDAACALAVIVPGARRLFSFSNDVVEVPPRAGMAGVDAIQRSQQHNGTLLGKAITHVNKIPHDRLIVVTDEQSQDAVPNPVCRRAYMVNVASARNGIGYGGGWTAHIDGFSENIFRFIAETERAAAD